MLSIEILHTKSDNLDGPMKMDCLSIFFLQMSYLPCHYLGVSVTLLEFPLLLMRCHERLMLQKSFFINLPHIQPSKRNLWVSCSRKKVFEPLWLFFFVEQPFKWLIKSWKKDNYTFSNAKVKTYSFATDTAQILKYTYTVSVPTIKHDHKGNNLN